MATASSPMPICKIGESKITSHSVMTMQGDTGYKTEVSATYDPPFMGMKDSTTTVEGKYVGPVQATACSRAT